MKIRNNFSKEDELEFLKEEQVTNPPYIRWIFLLFILLYAFFALVDLTYYPNNWQILFFIRFAIVIPLLIMAVGLSFKQSLARFYQYYIAVSFFVSGAGIAYMLILHPENIVYYGGLFMIYFSGYLLIKLRFYYATLSGLAIFLFHIIGTIIINNELSETVLFALLFYIGANVIGMAGAYQFEVKNRKQFLYEREITEKNSELKREYMEKEKQLIKLEQSIKENKALIAKNNELDRMTKSLKESEERFRVLHNASFGGIALHDKRLILDCNQGLSDITGYPMKELIGMDGLLLIAPDYRDYVMSKILSGYEEPYEVFGIRKNKEIYPLKLEARNIPYMGKQGRVVEFRDVTELKQKENQLIQSEEHYRLLTTEMQLGLTLNEIICDSNGKPIDFRFLSVNKSWEKLMGVPKKDVIGKTVLEVFPNTEKAWIESFGKVALTGDSRKFERYSTELDKYLSMSIYSPKKGQFATVVEDVTEKKKQEDLLKHTQRTDALTKIPNRLYFDEQLIKMNSKDNYPLAVLMMDINGLKLINDSFGQIAGNKVLKQFTRVLRSVKRKNDFIARISGDEFVMLMPKTSFDNVNHLRQKIANVVSKKRVENIEYSIAMGFAIKECSKETIAKTVIEAENAMYRNKIVYGQGTRSAAIESVFATLTNKYTYEKTHSKRVATYSRLIGQRLNLRDDELDELELAGRLHDIGKIAISDDIIMKPGPLTEEEWRKIKDHTIIGYQILRAADKYSNLADYAMSHHERMDGKGYPNGLKGDDIPLFARIIGVADAYEAMTANRTYRKAIGKDKAIQELKENSGTQFDPNIVDVFINKVLPIQ